MLINSNFILKTVRVLLLTLFLFSIHKVNATHNRAGEITYRQVGPLTIEITITTYTKTSSTGADRDSLEVFWGDGTSNIIKRSLELILPNDVKKNEYSGRHTYPGRSTYTIYFLDPNRVGNILNVNYPNSIDVPFFLSTTFTLLNTQFQGFNNSAILLQPPIDVACVGQKFVHNPNAFDIDGDSLAYELVEPLMDAGVPVPNYKFPNEIIPGPKNIAYIDEITGDFVWISPPQQGEYNIAILIKEFRKGVLINSIIRDMQIRINNCNNTPPIIEAEEELCVIAGELIDININIRDNDPRQQVLLTANGGPFVAGGNNTASLSNKGNYLNPEYTSNLIWQTDCSHVKKEPYQIVFRAVDNAFGDSLGLASFHTLRIKVVAPPPENLNALSVSGEVSLEWDLPYLCEGTTGFQGFSVWRKISPNPFNLDTCTTGLEKYNYQEIEFLTNYNDGEKYFHLDQNVEKGLTYCYRVQAEFALVTPTGSLYNRVESLPSNEICLQISRDIPIITKVSVEETSENLGETHIRWAKPLIEELDTTKNPGPYTIQIERSISGINNYLPLNQSKITFNSISSFLDTNYYDTNLNTSDIQYDYRLQFYTLGQDLIPYGTSVEASSIYLNLTPSDKRLTLNWEENTPWTNYTFDVYKEINPGDWQIVSTTDQMEYLDINLENGIEYCYFIEAHGSYAIDNLEDPILNRSQVACLSPVDNIAPCAPKLEVENICSEVDNISAVEELVNTLKWNDANFFCDRQEPISGYNIYFTPSISDTLQLLDKVSSSQTLEYEHLATENGLAGCYAVSAFDSLGNESELSNIVCIENCPLYTLPNTFTPNQDGSNDIFKPLKNFFISRVEFTVYNQWGNLVFESTDPNLNWDGRDIQSNKILHPGTYYYVCKVFAESVEGEVILEPVLSGYINLIK
jgi:gliding motility-associated-like protein